MLRATIASVLLATLIGTTSYGQNPDLVPDGVLDCQDIDVLHLLVVLGIYAPQADFNLDGSVDVLESAIWLQLAGNINLGPGRSYCPGDLNLDGFVDPLDFIIWNSNRNTPTLWYCTGDIDHDGFVGPNDFFIMQLFFGATC
ncbi:MAG: hypothetical protein AAF497_19005 [Planctomycetota bacterium]